MASTIFPIYVKNFGQINSNFLIRPVPNNIQPSSKRFADLQHHFQVKRPQNEQLRGVTVRNHPSMHPRTTSVRRLQGTKVISSLAFIPFPSRSGFKSSLRHRPGSILISAISFPTQRLIKIGRGCTLRLSRVSRLAGRLNCENLIFQTPWPQTRRRPVWKLSKHKLEARYTWRDEDASCVLDNQR